MDKLDYYEICRAFAKAHFAVKRSNASQDRFIFNSALANYESACEEIGISKPLCKTNIFDSEGSDEICFFPFK